MNLSPFEYAINFNGKSHVLCYCGVADRLDMIKDSTDILWLKRVVADFDSQITVRKAAERRLRKLCNSAAFAISPQPSAINTNPKNS